jgi:hypothetical protein
MNTWSIEQTDTFGGEANYCWVRQWQTEIPESYTRAWIVRKIKEQLGWTGDKISVEDWGDYLTLRHSRHCEIAFATLRD